MNLRIIQGGQTGVDRGAWRGAVECGFARGGWMPHDMRDEHGPIPADVADDLWQHSGGLLERTAENVNDADAVICIVEDAARGCTTRGTRGTWGMAKHEQRPVIVIDGSSLQTSRVAPWLRDLAVWRNVDLPEFSLMVAGPRASLWPEGEETARRIVHVIAEACRG